MNINGKKAIVFGGTSGIGLSATQMLSEKGAHVIAISRNPEKLTQLPKNVTTKKINVLDRDAVGKFFQDEGEFDILVKFFFAFGFFFHLFCIGVSIGPGKILLERIFLLAY